MTLKSIFLSLILCLFFSQNLFAQSQELDYMESIQDEFYAIMESYMDYNAKIVHSENKTGVEQKRQALVAQIRTSKAKINQIKPLKGGEKLKTASLILCDKLITQFDAAHRKAITMREKGNGSYEEMEKFVAYIESIQKESDKAWEGVDTVFEQYANAHGIKVVQDNSKFAQTLQQVGELNNYQYKIFLILFRSRRPNVIFWASIKRKNPESASYALKEIENSLTFSIKEITEMGSFKGDDSYRQSVLKMLNYIQTCSQKEYQMLIDYYIMAYKPEEETQKVEKFMTTYNNTYEKMNETMENVQERFIKKYTPKTPIKRTK